MKIHPLTVGPIVGATTGNAVHLWGRGMLELVAGGPRRCFGVARLRATGQSAYDQPRFCKMNPNFDMTGIVVFDELIPATRYDYQFGCFFSDFDLDMLTPDTAIDWSEASTSSFTTATDDTDQPLSFVFGSCRYLLRLFGGAWFDTRGDKTFRSILDQINAGQPTAQILMLGDQIYADDLNFLAPDTTLDQYNRRYREVFTQPCIRELMSRIPTYMTLDDHEIEDNWPAHSSDKDLMTLYPAAIHAYLTYQLSHSPLFDVTDHHVTGTPERLWYVYSKGCCDFFVTDTRTERYLVEDEYEREIMSEGQLTALINWLSDGSGQVKVIASAVPFFPDARRKLADKWSGFPHQRNALLATIRQQQVRRVVFLAGDVHASMSAELIHPEYPDFKIISVVSSPFFWPYPHPRSREFILDGTLVNTQEPYTVVNASPVYTDDNFTRVTIDRTSLKAEIFTRKGEWINSTIHQF
jgi:alkaline phosphatase D